MKYKITIKSIRNDSRAKISVRYGDLQNVFRCFDFVRYSAGVYGWNFDVYDTATAVITTGYRYTVGKLAPAEAVAHADAAFTAWCDAHPAATRYELRRAAGDVLDSFCREVLTPETHTLTAAD